MQTVPSLQNITTQMVLSLRPPRESLCKGVSKRGQEGGSRPQTPEISVSEKLIRGTLMIWGKFGFLGYPAPEKLPPPRNQMLLTPLSLCLPV